jgi:hypothetical protein
VRLEARQLPDRERARTGIVRRDLDHALERDEAAAAVRFEERTCSARIVRHTRDEALATAELVGPRGTLSTRSIGPRSEPGTASSRTA